MESSSFPVSEGKACQEISILDPRLREKLLNMLRFGLLGELWAMTMMIACVNVLYGFAWNPAPYLRNDMKIAVVNNDPSGLIGKVLASVVGSAHSYGLNYQFRNLDSSISWNDLKDLVDEGKYWGALYLHEGSSYNLLAAVLNKTATAKSYDASTVLSYTYDQGRPGPSYQVALGALGGSLATIVNIGTKTALAAYLSSTGYNTSSVLSSVIVNPVGVQTEVLHPVKLYGVQNALGNGLMQVYLISLVITISVIKMHTELEGRGIKKSHLAYAILIHRLLSSLILALWPPVVLIILDAGSDIIDGNKFLRWWAFLWLAITTFNVINHHLYKTVSITVGFLAGLFMLMLQVSSSTGSIPFDGMPSFFKIGYGLPFMNVVQGSRAILLGSSTNTLSRNIGVLFIWVGCFAVTTFYYCQSYLNRTSKAMRYHLFSEPEDEAAEVRQIKRDSWKQSSASEDEAAAVAPTQPWSLSAPAPQALLQSRENSSGGVVDADQNKAAEDTVGPSKREPKTSGEEEEEGELEANTQAVAQEDSANHENKEFSANGISSSQSPEALALKECSPDYGNNDNEMPNTALALKECSPDDGNNDNEMPNTADAGGVEEDEKGSSASAAILTPVEAPDTLPIWDPSVREILVKNVIKKGIVIEIIAIIFFLIILLITYGSVWDPSKYYHNINVAVLNLDPTSSSSVIGASFDTALTAFRKVAPYNFNIEVLDNSYETYNTLYHKISRGHYWAGVVIGEKASSNLASVLYDTSTTATSSYSTGTAAMTFIIDTGRGGSYVTGLLKIWGAKFAAIYNYVVSKKLTILSQYARLKFSKLNGYALLNPVRQTVVDLHPLPTIGMDGAICGGAVTLYLGMIAHVNVIFAAQRPLEEMGVKYSHRIMAQIAHLLVGTFFLAMWPALSVLWHGADLSGQKFFQLWAMFALGMTSMGSLIVLNYHTFGKEYGGVVNVIVFSLNQASATVSMPFELQHPFWRIGMGMPYYQIIVCLRVILFGSEALPFRRAIGVSFAWIGFVGLCAVRLMIRRRRFGKLAEILRGSLPKKPSQRMVCDAAAHEENVSVPDGAELTGADTGNPDNKGEC